MKQKHNYYFSRQSNDIKIYLFFISYPKCFDFWDDDYAEWNGIYFTFSQLSDIEQEYFRLKITNFKKKEKKVNFFCLRVSLTMQKIPLFFKGD